MALAPQAKKMPTQAEVAVAVAEAPPLDQPPQPSYIFSTKEELSVVSGERYDVFADGLVITVTEQGYADAVADFTKKFGTKHRRAVEVIPGKYWRIGTFGGQPCFRQEATGDDAPNNLELFLYWCGKKDVAGWYIATDLNHHAQTELLAWGAERVVGACSVFPDKLHVPALATSPNTEVLVEMISSWSDGQYAELKTTYEDLKGTYDAFIGGADGGGGVVAGEPLVEMAADAAPGAEPDAELDPHDDDMGKGKGKDGKGKHSKKNTSGWLNRACPLVQACLDKEWDTAFQVAKSLAREPTMRTVLDKGIGYRELKGFKGKGKGSSWGSNSWSSSSWY